MKTNRRRKCAGPTTKKANPCATLRAMSLNLLLPAEITLSPADNGPPPLSAKRRTQIAEP